MDQQQNGQRQKGPHQNGLRKSDRVIKSCTLVMVSVHLLES